MDRIPRIDTFYKADALYLPALYRDLRSGSELMGWNPPSTPYLFPDIPLFFLINFIVGNFHLAIFLYGIVQYVLFIIGLILLSKFVFGPRQSIHFLILATGTLTGLLISGGEARALIPMFLSGYHFGTVLNSILCLLIVARILQAGRTLSSKSIILHSCALFMVSLLASASDALFLVQFLIPALGGFWMLLLASRVSHRQLFYSYIALVPAAPIGFWLNRAVLIYRQPRAAQKITPEVIAGNIVRAKEALASAWAQGDWFPRTWLSALAIVWVCFLLACLIAVLCLLYRGERRDPGPFRSHDRGAMIAFLTFGIVGTGIPILTFRYPGILWGTFVVASLGLWLGSHKESAAGVPASRTRGGPLFLVTWLLLMVIVSVGGAIIAGKAQSRYLLPAMLIPLAFGWPFLSGCWKRCLDLLGRAGIQVGILLTLTGLLALFGNFSQAARLTGLADFYPSPIRCLDSFAERRNLHNGMAQYWLAKPITMLSKKRLMVVQVRKKLTPFHWINNLNWYNRQFDFVVVDDRSGRRQSVESKRVQAKYGSPAAVFACHDWKVLVYDRAKDIAFRQQFLDLFNRSFDAVRLPSETGRVIGSSRIAEEGLDDKGGLTESPRLRLPVGDYRVEIVYSSSTGGSPTGDWDAILRVSKGRKIVLKKGEIRPRGRGMISEVISIRRPGQTEIRTFYRGRGFLRIDSLLVKRIR